MTPRLANAAHWTPHSGLQRRARSAAATCRRRAAAQWPRATRQVGGGGDVSAAASLKAASSTAVKSKCSPGERCAGPGARITFVLRSRALAS